MLLRLHDGSTDKALSKAWQSCFSLFSFGESCVFCCTGQPDRVPTDAYDTVELNRECVYRNPSKQKPQHCK